MTESLFGQVEAFAGNPILWLNDSFKADPRTEKVNLSIGVYTDENGHIAVLAAVKAAYERTGFAERPYLPDGRACALSRGRAEARLRRRASGALPRSASRRSRPSAARERSASPPISLPSTAPAGASSSATRPGRTITACSSARASRRPPIPVGPRQPLGRFRRHGQGAASRGERLHRRASAGLPQPDRRRSRRTPAAAVTDVLVAKRHIWCSTWPIRASAPASTRTPPSCAVMRSARAASSPIVLEEFIALRRALRRPERRVPRCGQAERVLGQLKLAVAAAIQPADDAGFSSPPCSATTTCARNGKARRDHAQSHGFRAQAPADEVRAISNEIDIDFLTTQRGMFSYTGLSAPRSMPARARRRLSRRLGPHVRGGPQRGERAEGGKELRRGDAGVIKAVIPEGVGRSGIVFRMRRRSPPPPCGEELAVGV